MCILCENMKVGSKYGVKAVVCVLKYSCQPRLEQSVDGYACTHMGPSIQQIWYQKFNQVIHHPISHLYLKTSS